MLIGQNITKQKFIKIQKKKNKTNRQKAFFWLIFAPQRAKLPSKGWQAKLSQTHFSSFALLRLIDPK